MLGTPSDRVLIDVVPDGLGGGLLQHVGRWKVGKALGEVDGIVLVGQPRHPADDGFREAMGTSGGVHGVQR